MAYEHKRRHIEKKSDSGGESDGQDEEEMNPEELETIEVDFDVLMPTDGDFHGIKNLLQQLFLKAHINLSELAEILIQQNKITGVLKQADDVPMDDDDDEMDATDVNFGVFSVINISNKRNTDCMKSLHTHLLSHCKKSASDAQFQELRKMLEDPNRHVGLIISERMINIPPKISAPLFSQLKEDMSKARGKGQAYDFEHYLLISKIVVFNEGKADENVIYTNAEEELIAEESSLSFDYSVSGEQDSGLDGAWTDDDDCEGHCKRRVLVFPATKYDTVCKKLIDELGVGVLTS